MDGLGIGSGTRWNGKRTAESLLCLGVWRVARRELLVPDTDGRTAWADEGAHHQAFAEYFIGPDVGEENWTKQPWPQAVVRACAGTRKRKAREHTTTKVREKG